MSDSEPDFDDPRFLLDLPAQPQTELSYTERRKRKQIESELKGRNKSRKQTEQEKRDEGLQNSLFDKAERDQQGTGGESKALKMMKAMGFKPGDSLGKQGNVNGGFARASFAPASSSTSTNSEPTSTNTTNEPRRALHKNEPIKFEIRTGRTGLGVPQPRKPLIYPSLSSGLASSSSSREPHTIDSTPLPNLDQFLFHIRSSIDSKRAFGILKSCRRTLEELDRRNGIEMNPMWLDPEEVEREEIKFRNKRLFERLDRELEGDQEKGVSEEEREKRRDKSELDYLRGRSETVVELDEEREEREDEERTKDEERRVRKEREGQEEQETQNWFAMDVSTRLALTLSYLRHHYHYCFWCGCQYNDMKDLEENCPGEDEDSH
ncbi:hypothetical protein JCM5353_004361 [Sporobolomyces roseus]